MRIAIIGAVDTPIKKDALGGTEIWTYNFAQKLQQRGHQVVLCANDKSEFSGDLRKYVKQEEVYENEREGNFSNENIVFLSSYQLAKLLTEKEKFDIIHISSTNFQNYLPYSLLTNIPMVVTIHYSILSFKNAENIFNYIKNPNYVFISHNFASRWPKPKKYSVIYNGIDVESFPFTENKKDYYFWMSRIHRTKGAEDAVIFSRLSGKKVVLAGPIREQAYFDQVIKPFLGPNLEYVGSLNFEQKVEYYRHAKAFLMPIKWDEPFGLVAVEAMACGTPVIGYARGALPEIIETGQNGLLVKQDDIKGLVSLIPKIDHLDPSKIRQSVINKFDINVMVDNYIELYRKIIGEKDESED